MLRVPTVIVRALNAKKLDWIAAHRSDAANMAEELGLSAAKILGLSALGHRRLVGYGEDE